VNTRKIPSRGFLRNNLTNPLFFIDKWVFGCIIQP
jgi:hypothetical protein